MHAVRYHRHGGPGVLQVDEVDRPEPGEGELLVDVRAASVNHLDARFREGGGRYEPASLPATPGVDFAGVVVEAGNWVRGLEPGDRVVGDGVDAFSRYAGSYAEYLVAPADRVVGLPEQVAFDAAAAAAHVGLTAWQAIVESGRPAPGDTCLVHGAAGGVGHLAVQLAATLGADVIGTAGAEPARERVRELGADVVLDYRDADLADRLREASGTVGPPDVVLDHRLHDYLELDVDVAARGARLVTIAGDEVTFGNASLAVGKGLTLHFVSPARLPDRTAALRTVATLLADGTLAVDVADRFPLADAADAHRALAAGGHVGKLVLEST